MRAATRTGIRSLRWPVIGVPLALLCGVSRAQEDATALNSIEAQAAMRSRLESFMLLVTVTPKTQEMQDPSFTPRQFGLAVRVLESGAAAAAILTSEALIAATARIEVATASDPGHLFDARAIERPRGLAELACETPGPCEVARGAAAPVAPAGSCDPRRVLYALEPAGEGRFVLVPAVVAARGGVLPDDLALIQGLFARGTPLFDAEGRIAAIVVRPAEDGSPRSLAAPLSAAGPDQPEPPP